MIDERITNRNVIKGIELKDMKKWIRIGIGLLIIFIVSVSFLLYYSIQPLKMEEEKAFSIALEQSSLVEVKDFHWFRYEEEYYVVTGLNQDGEETIVWINAENREVTVEHKVSEGLSEEEVLEDFKDEWNMKEIIEMKLGYANKRPLWEITFIDEDNKYTFLQVSFLTGDWIRYYQYKEGGVS